MQSLSYLGRAWLKIIMLATLIAGPSCLVQAEEPPPPPATDIPAESPQPAFRAAVLFEPGSQTSDHAFTEAAKEGVKLAEHELKISISEYDLSPKDDREILLEKIAKDGATHIIAVGFQNVVPVVKLAEKYPDIKFTVMDGSAPPLYTNVQSVLFKDHEGAFLVGMIAAITSKSGVVGFVGGMDVPLIRNFASGYTQGAKYAKPGIQLLTDMVGNTRDAWSNPAQASVLAQKQFDAGADIIFAAAGGSGLGVLASAKQNNRLAIGVDTNQNGLYPGYVLTSMVKRVDKAIYDVLRHAQAGTWQPGIKYLGVKEGMLDFVVDNNNRDLISHDTIEKVEAAKDLMIRGIINVQVYSPE